MAAAYTNLYIEQGTTYTTTITLDDVYGSIYDLTSISAKAQIRKSYYSANATAQFSTTINTSTGTITLGLAANVSSNIASGRYVYDTTITDSNGNVTRILEGIVDVSPSVTR
ncbi:hypothetical protein UFOVP250_2 [uncultured Caudovirales phage]|uniref:Uncharacterized protein n=1 Tax=uncultured Caudovirales phage TaxID=2100421 RepID=A0A6J5LFB3_9CAUD|nr:hypothetical protein UFOVP250_2 [uncultured Caudovirales phage]